ncbi:MAG: hypothetical protein ACERKV_01150 [Clostridiaceae bacterium]
MYKRIHITTTYDVSKTIDALQYLKEIYKNSTIEFLGWSCGNKVISIDDDDYFLFNIINKITLKETHSKNIEILETKIDRYNAYNEILR